MKNIKVFALGGLNEIGMNMYVIEIDKKIFVLDAGIKYTSGLSLGVDYILPDYDYLIKNQKNIVGIFITHAHDPNMGALCDLITDIPSINIYASKLALDFLKLDLKDNNVNSKGVKFHEVKAHETIKCGAVSVYPVQVTHSIPEALAYVINTKYGAILYTGDFCFDPEAKDGYQMDIGKLAYIGKKGVFLLLSDSIDVDKPGSTAPSNHLFDRIMDVLEKYDNRLIVNVSEHHIALLEELLEAAQIMHRIVIIMGSPLQRRMNILYQNGYLTKYKKIIGSLEDVNKRNALIVVAHTEDHPYQNIKRIIKGYDKFIKPEDTDTFFMLEPVTIANEKPLSILMDDIAKTGCEVISTTKKEYRPYHPSRQDILMLLNMTAPKYFMPVRGNYRNMSLAAELALKQGVKKENILLRLNGEVSTFEKGVLNPKIDVIKLDPKLIDGKSTDNIGDLVLKDREILGEEGIVLVSCILDSASKEILSGPEIVTKGFVYVKESHELLDEAKEIARDVIKKYTGSKIDYNAVKNDIRKNLSKLFMRETSMRPLIISVVQEV